MNVFDEVTAVRAVSPGRYVAVLDGGWSAAGRPNGGYLIAVVTRAALTAADRAHPLAVSTHFLTSATAGPADILVEVLRAGRSVSVVRGRLAQDGRAVLESTITAGQLDPSAEPQWQAATAPDLPPLQDCVESKSDLPNGVRVGLLDHVDLRLDPATVRWAVGRPGRELRLRGWLRFRDERPPDPLSLLLAVDSLPPTVFDLGAFGWAPTVELTAYVRGTPAPGWLHCHARTRLVRDGWFDEEVEVWDAAGALVAQSRQLAGFRPPRPG